MTRKLGVLGLSLLAVLALGAVMASAASAAAKFEVEGGVEARYTEKQIAGTVTGVTVEKGELTTKAGTAKCTLAEFDGVLKKESTELSLTPTYGSVATPCTLAGTKIEVRMNECKYLLTATETLGSENKISVEMHLLCPPGKVAEYQVTGTKCVITYPAQTFSSTAVTAENTLTATPKMDVDEVLDTKELVYEVHDPETIKQCPNGNKITDTVLTKDGTTKEVLTSQGDTIPGGAAVGVTVT